MSVKDSVDLHDDASKKEEYGDNEVRPVNTYIDDGAANISQSHREYLLQRHGTLNLEPLPSEDPADPYNWPVWKKTINLCLVAFHACMTVFMSAGIIPAFADIAMDLGVSLQRASYLTSATIAILGASPLFWKPLSNRYGRRPMWLISTLLAGVLNVGCAVCHSYGTMMTCRCLMSFFISPAMAIGSGVVTETFFQKDRGRYMGVWTLMVTLGPPAGPFFMGFVAYHAGYRWIYWTFAIINAVQFVAYFFFGPETRYIRRGAPHSGSTFKKEYLNFGRIDPTPFNPIEFISPAFLARYMTILIPTISYTIVFGFASVYLTVEIPQLFIPVFHFNPQQIGLQFLGMIIGSVIGEQMGGPLSDWWMNRKTKKNGNNVRPPPEYRLWLSYFGFTLAIVGFIVFGVQVYNATPGHWNVSPIIGIGIAACGNQIITTVLVTYAIDCHHEHSTSIGVFINLIRSTWGFIGPFWFPDMINAINPAGSGGLEAGLVFIVSVLPVAALQFLRRKK